MICIHNHLECWHLRKKYKVKLEDTVKIDKDCCENSDGDFGIFQREFKFGGID